jgi:hypothetical protein
MRARLTKLVAGLTAAGALAFGGAALAGAASNPSPPAPPVASAPADTDTIQQGDQTAPDTGTAASESSSESVSSESASESTSSESAPESTVASDGPGGHADEPGNASADYQFQGEQ